MANNKVQLEDGTVLIDLTDTTAIASDVISGKCFYNASGEKIMGSLIIQYYYTGSEEPSVSLGNNGDIYLQES